MYAADEFLKAQENFSKATSEISEQEKAFFLTRNFDNANQLLKEAVAQLDAAKVAAVANKEKVRQEVEALTIETEAAIESAKTALAKAPRGKDTKVELETMKADLEATTTALAEAKEMYAKGDYMAAKASLTQSMQKASDVSSEVEMARLKVRGGKRPAVAR